AGLPPEVEPSMGPRPASRGDQARRDLLGESPETFNGATASEPWRSEPVPQRQRVRVFLQWGHGQRAVEMRQSRIRKSPFKGLQWGHGQRAVEMPRAGPTQTTGEALQWGHGQRAVEMAAHTSELDRLRVDLQWGHGQRAVEI